jgi:hypothetical protein
MGLYNIGKRAAIATAVLLVSTSAYTAPVTLVCNGKVSLIRWDKKANPMSGIVIENRIEGEQWTVTIDTATQKLTLNPFAGSALPGIFRGDGDDKSISMQASIDAFKDAAKDDDDLKGWVDAGLVPLDGSINRITGAFVVTIPTRGEPKREGWEYSGTCKPAKPIF